MSITNFEVIEHYNLKVYQLNEPIRVMVANGQSDIVTQYTRLGPILGKALILPGANQTLVSVPLLCLRGFTVVFEGTHMGVYFNTMQILSAEMDLDTKLYYISLDDVIFGDHAICMASTTLTEVRPIAHRKQRQDGRITPGQIRTVHWLHKRMGHASKRNIIASIRNGNWRGLPENITPQMVEKVLSDQPCTSCALGKRNKLDKREGSGVGPTRPGQMISIDYVGPITPVSIRGFNGYFIFKCLRSGYINIYLTTLKSSEFLQAAIKEEVQFYNLHGFIVEVFRFDSGSVELAAPTSELLKKLDIRPDPAAVGSQFQNPVEREVQTMVKITGVNMLDQEALQDEFWCYGTQHFRDTSNATSRSDEPSPDEIVLGIAPDLSTHFQFPFGCPVTSTKTEGRHNRFDVASEFGIAVGSVPITQSNRATLVYIPGKSRNGKIFERLDVLPLKISIPGITDIDKTGQHVSTQQRGQYLPEMDPSGAVKFRSPARQQTNLPGTMALEMFESAETHTTSATTQDPLTAQGSPLASDNSHLTPIRKSTPQEYTNIANTIEQHFPTPQHSTFTMVLQFRKCLQCPEVLNVLLNAHNKTLKAHHVRTQKPTYTLIQSVPG
jgi:hypothetical protein